MLVIFRFIANSVQNPTLFSEVYCCYTWREKEESELLDREQEAKLLNLSGNEALHSCFNVWENKNLVDYGFTETLYTKNKVRLRNKNYAEHFTRYYPSLSQKGNSEDQKQAFRVILCIDLNMQLSVTIFNVL